MAARNEHCVDVFLKADLTHFAPLASTLLLAGRRLIDRWVVRHVVDELLETTRITPQRHHPVGIVLVLEHHFVEVFAFVLADMEQTPHGFPPSACSTA